VSNNDVLNFFPMHKDALTQSLCIGQFHYATWLNVMLPTNFPQQL
jgi:hypothetical protein